MESICEYWTTLFELIYSENKRCVLNVTLHLVDGYIQTDVYSTRTATLLYRSLSSLSVS